MAFLLDLLFAHHVQLQLHLLLRLVLLDQGVVLLLPFAQQGLYLLGDVVNLVVAVDLLEGGIEILEEGLDVLHVGEVLLVLDSHHALSLPKYVVQVRRTQLVLVEDLVRARRVVDQMVVLPVRMHLLAAHPLQRLLKRQSHREHSVDSRLSLIGWGRCEGRYVNNLCVYV